MRSDTSTNPRKLPTQDRSKETVEAILQATALVLKREGYDRASTSRVAEAAGVSVEGMGVATLAAVGLMLAVAMVAAITLPNKDPEPELARRPNGSPGQAE